MAKSKSDEKAPNYRCSTSHLLNYISVLMQSDDSLNAFLANPVTACEHHHLTKAERSVLRRVVAHLSNNSTNGYGIIRHLGSYRRSLRLLQNVLHHTGAKLIQDITPVEEGLYGFTMKFYTPNVDASIDFTRYTNAEVGGFGGPFVSHAPFYVVFLPDNNPSIAMVLEKVIKTFGTTSSFSSNNKREFDIRSYNTTPEGKFIKSFTFENLSTKTPYTLTADLDQYKLEDDYVFWFYSINGKPNPFTSGGKGKSFKDYKLNPGDAVYWQLIAPDSSYGFSPCKPPSKTLKVVEAD